jgi:hypothetical protein
MHLCVLRGFQNKQHYLSLQHQLIGFYNRGKECLLRGTDWVFKSDRYSFVLKGLNVKYVGNSISKLQIQVAT